EQLNSARVVHTHHTDMTALHKMIKEKATDPQRPPRLPITIQLQSPALVNIQLDEHAQSLSGKLL
ncbi:hypothetical protein PMAYCL1PPCAC_25370, partial [Pristionchus mayeri]